LGVPAPSSVVLRGCIAWLIQPFVASGNSRFVGFCYGGLADRVGSRRALPNRGGRFQYGEGSWSRAGSGGLGAFDRRHPFKARHRWPRRLQHRGNLAHSGPRPPCSSGLPLRAAGPERVESKSRRRLGRPAPVRGGLTRPAIEWRRGSLEPRSLSGAKRAYVSMFLGHCSHGFGSSS
jgi:hypothetical protein